MQKVSIWLRFLIEICSQTVYFQGPGPQNLVFYDVFCTVPSKTRVYLLLWPLGLPWGAYWALLAPLGLPIVLYWCSTDSLLTVIGLFGPAHWALLGFFVPFMVPSKTLALLDVLGSCVPLGSPLDA